MNLQISCNTSVILVAYHHNNGVIARINALLEHAKNCSITVVDMSSTKYRQRWKLGNTLKAMNPDIIYMPVDASNRFSAYNFGLKSSNSQYVMFRTDGDVFDEQASFKIIDDGFEEDFIFTPYLFGEKYQHIVDYRRPIESVIFKTAFLNQLLPFETKPNSDWDLLKRAHIKGRAKEESVILLNKAFHCRDITSL
jgi:hypothetical protein